MRLSTLTWAIVASMLSALPAFADSAAIGTIRVSPELRSALQSAPNPGASPNAVQPVSSMAEIENSLEISPVPARPEPRVYRQFEEPRNGRGFGFKVGI
ncbi:hypothetical protein NK55_03490 [Thermosynechococcus sp. NK55a]|jgi:hypothetical protein|uniref:hypothetical protein n=1 Tax=unclassified Thermosynechococcus TaxID=2622553 RepID=UPI0003D7D666|nr:MULTISPECIES: hypothetical protein [unclassified Thermosynechococcus]AHB88042.1 hypothetical protein NK55_03490 [Thermosynechococcus sp. NK55a]RMH64544.1 MAG: hypothetical protein D6676_09390 [Cyanobacteria bacterium J003]HIK24213.1 hypothetical protein [Thermosynechococcus sp. M3746_W2019_013]